MNKSDIRNKLEESSSRIFFNELKIDILSDVIFIVDLELDLINVSEACALDQSDVFKKWINENQIRRPEQIEIDFWQKENSQFECCIVKPFIFLQKAMVN